MINIICTSNFDGLESMRESVSMLGHKFKLKQLIEINHIEISMESLDHIRQSDVCIFQSKNATNQVKKFKDSFSKDKEYYAVGIFTAKSVEASINVNCKYPRDNYSSKDLIKEYKLDIMSGKEIVILKGNGGLSIIKESLKEKNIVKEIIVYERQIQKDIIDLEDFDGSVTNVIICMSQDALKSLCNHYNEIIKRNETFLIVPNDRFISDEIKIFDKVFTLKSTEYQKEILNIIQNSQ